ncbi:MAG: HEAT repeat domain-containing protein [Elusimicrobia bacterium]|nr:HEAT repeat domain-containing protein [Elusimicrobiota bacterium]
MNQPKKPLVSSELVNDLLLNLQATLKGFRLYPLEHPLLLKAVDKLKQSVNQFFTEGEVLRLRLKRQYIFVGGQIINKGDEILETLSLQIYRLGIRELTFKKGLSDDELIKFLRFLNIDPGQLFEKGGIEAVWEQEHFTSLKINETLQQEIFRIGPYSSQSPKGSGQNNSLGAVVLLGDFLEGQEKNLSREAHLLLGELMSKPAHLAGMLQALARAEQSEQSDVFEQDYTVKAFGKLIQVVQQQPIEQQKNCYQQLARSLDSFSPELKHTSLDYVLNQSRADPTYANLLAEITLTDLTQLLGKKMNSGASEEQIETIINSLPMSHNNKHSLFKELKIAAKLELAEKLVGLEKTQQLALSPAEVTEIQYQLPPDINYILGDLSHYTDQELKEIEKLTQATEKNQLIETFLQVMTELLRIEQDQEKHKILSQKFEMRVKDYLDAHEFDWALKYLAVVRELWQDPSTGAETRKLLHQLLINLGAKEIVQKLSEAIRSMDKDDLSYRLINNYLNLLPGDSTPDLLELLRTEERLALRRLLCQVISEVGKNKIEFLWEKLSDPDWHLVRNIVFILGLINNEQSLACLGELVEHENSRVRLEVIKSLGLSGNPKVFDYLLKGLTDKDPQVRNVTVEWLGNLQDKRAIPVLLKIVKKFDPFGLTASLKREAIESLGLLKARAAEPFLERLVNRHWIGFIGSRKSLLPEAEKALAQIKGLRKK